jgi:hypothetical protein
MQFWSSSALKDAQKDPLKGSSHMSARAYAALITRNVCYGRAAVLFETLFGIATVRSSVFWAGNSGSKRKRLPEMQPICRPLFKKPQPSEFSPIPSQQWFHV